MPPADTGGWPDAVRGRHVGVGRGRWSVAGPAGRGGSGSAMSGPPSLALLRVLQREIGQAYGQSGSVLRAWVDQAVAVPGPGGSADVLARAGRDCARAATEADHAAGGVEHLRRRLPQ